jgi:hypothetical protein
MLERCSYIPKVLKTFECELESVRLLRLGVQSNIIEHRDYMLGFEDGVARIHIPVETNPLVEFRLKGEVLQMREGEAWYLNFNLPHSVANDGKDARIHLVIDCLVNDWVSNIFAARTESKAEFKINAACLHLKIDPQIVFHPGGYKGNSEALLRNFSFGVFLGVNQLEDAGMTLSEKKATELGLSAYPKMIKWCRD